MKRIPTGQVIDWFNNFNTEAVEIRSVVIGCPECSFTVDTTVMNDGLRQKIVCRNYQDCDVYKFEVSKELIEEFHVTLKVQEYQGEVS